MHPSSPLDDAQALRTLARQLVSNCPDMRQVAREIAQGLIKKHTGLALEPDNVWWHLWDNTQGSPRTYNGWVHDDRPIQSLTFPQLVVHRFASNFQENPDALQEYGGFYQAGPWASIYDQSNEVRILPQQILKDFWAIDFRWYYENKLNQYWEHHARDFRTLAKARYLASALADRQALRISDDHFQTLVRAVAGNVSWPVDLATLEADHHPQPGLAVYPFDISGIVSSDILRIVETNGRQYLYVPGELNAFHVFETPYDLLWWVLGETNMAENRARFMSHFCVSDQQQGNTTGLNHLLDVLVYHLGAHHSSVFNQVTTPITQDPFTFLQQAAKARMHNDAALLLPTNGEYRKIMWIGYLGAASKVFSPIAAVDWPVALALVGAGIAGMGLNIDQSINGRTTALREKGVVGAIFSAIDILFNATMLGGPLAEAFQGIKAIEPAQAIAEVERALPSVLRSSDTPALLRSMESNEVLKDTASTAEGHMKGVQVNGRGEMFIEIADLPYCVRYVSELKTWVVIDPANPFSFYKNVPVKLNDAGLWEPLKAGGLRGGGGIFGKKPWGRAVAPAQEVRTPTYRYDTPQALRGKLRNAANGHDNKMLQGWANIRDEEENEAFVQLRALRDKLHVEAEHYFEHVALPSRPTIVDLDPITQEKYFLKEHLDRAPGLVIGESHASIGSKKLLIDNMALLAREDVRTLYMEHLLTDFHQADLDAFARTGELNPALEQYLDDLDKGFHTDPSGQFTFKELVRVANQHHIRIQAIDCLASYRLSGMNDTTGNLRQKMMNYVAQSVIKGTQRIRDGGKWVALMGNTHANTFAGVPGVSELEGAIGIRVEDVPSTQGRGLRPDPGLHVEKHVLDPGGDVKCDLLYQMQTLADHPATIRLENKLIRPGMFAVDNSTQPPQIVHRTGDNTLAFTPIHTEANFVYIQRPRWTYINDRRFESLRELITAMKVIGMTHME
ncbi:MAG: membrane-targeted effector domain-containing toxin [Pseudomonas sp.]|nr:membrane-targeted effector domain-containing toxin [Pseudomonas sp.]